MTKNEMQRVIEDLRLRIDRMSLAATAAGTSAETEKFKQLAEVSRQMWISACQKCTCGAYRTVKP